MFSVDSKYYVKSKFRFASGILQNIITKIFHILKLRIAIQLPKFFLKLFRIKSHILTCTTIPFGSLSILATDVHA